MGKRLSGSAVAACLVLVTGCQLIEPEQNRYGLGPVIASADVRSVTSEQDLILDYLATGVPTTFRDPRDYWYEVTVAGFNYVDQKCDEYLYNLYVRGKRSSRTKSLIAATSTLTSAILSVTDVSTATMGIVAQAFGFGLAVNDAFAESYLINIGPSAVAGTVKKLRNEYRDLAFADQVANGTVRGRTTATNRIRGYLELCMPVFIEGQISDYVAKAGAGKAGADKEDKAEDDARNEIAEARRAGGAASLSVTLVPPR